MSTALTKIEETKLKSQWWQTSSRRDIFNHVLQGKSLNEIVEATSQRIDSVHNSVKHDYFLKRVEDYLTAQFYLYQIQKVMSMPLLHSHLLKIVMGSKVDEALTSAKAADLLVKINTHQEKDPKVINPKQYNFFINMVKEATPEELPEKLKDIRTAFGFEGLTGEVIEEHESNDTPLATREPSKN